MVSYDGEVWEKEVIELYSENELFDLIGIEIVDSKSIAFMLPNNKDIAKLLKPLFFSELSFGLKRTLDKLLDVAVEQL